MENNIKIIGTTVSILKLYTFFITLYYTLIFLLYKKIKIQSSIKLIPIISIVALDSEQRYGRIDFIIMCVLFLVSVYTISSQNNTSTFKSSWF